MEENPENVGLTLEKAREWKGDGRDIQREGDEGGLDTALGSV